MLKKIKRYIIVILSGSIIVGCGAKSFVDIKSNQLIVTNSQLNINIKKHDS